MSGMRVYRAAALGQLCDTNPKISGKCGAVHGKEREIRPQNQQMPAQFGRKARRDGEMISQFAHLPVTFGAYAFH